MAEGKAPRFVELSSPSDAPGDRQQLVIERGLKGGRLDFVPISDADLLELIARGSAYLLHKAKRPTA